MKKEIQILFEQLGGNHFITMTGSRNLVYDNEEVSLSMQLIPNKSRARYFKVILCGNDTYTLTFSKISGKGTEIEKVMILKSMEGVHFDMLQPIFTEVTGLRTCL